MNKIKNCVMLILILLSISMIEIVNVKADTGQWSGCINKLTGIFYNFQPGNISLNICSSGDYNASFYDKSYVDNLTITVNNQFNQINNLTNQLNIQNNQIINLINQVNNQSNQINNLTYQVNTLNTQQNNLTSFTTIHDFAPAGMPSLKSFNNVYQNRLNKPIFVDVSALCIVGAGETCVIQGLVASVNPPPGENNTIESGAYHTQSAIGIAPAISFIVPPGYYYEVTTSIGGSPTLYLDHWNEWS